MSTFPRSRPSRALRQAAFAVLACLFGSQAALLSAETVINKDGESYTGEVTLTPHVVKCVSPGVNRTFALPVVRDIVLSGGEQATFELRRRKLPPLDAEAHHQLGMWLKSRHQHGAAQEFFLKALTIEADHAASRRELGYVRKDDTWTYSPALHQRMMIDWVGRRALAFHLSLAHELRRLGLPRQEEQELRRVLQADPTHPAAIGMIRPLIADYRCRNRYRLPFEGTWRAVSGPQGAGHSRYAFMMNAWDFRKVDAEGRTWSGDYTKLESHYTFEQPVYACADGEVYNIRDGFPDNPVGRPRRLNEANRIHIRHANGERSVIGHLQKGSIRVKKGDRVRQGQLIGLLGNSGRSVTPHIHFAVFDTDGISLPVQFVDFDVHEPTGARHIDVGAIELGKVYENRFDETGHKRP